ncbi:Pentatricopeptide repeat [Macleaya cordata]|uniref:Pentatricopeptide repeat n=1 Tax=Macleaya cordata TaxID=56857 RepID=A0A200R113_MACCD|nr:Pentatricopeptide repeat [Macleaya cordata]
MEERGVHADCKTYIWLLEGCLNSGSIKDAKRIHGRILKSGFDGDSVLCAKLIDFYLGIGDLSGAMKVFDFMPERSVSTWNNMISGFLKKKTYFRVLDLFLRMLEDHASPNNATFASILRACSGANVDFHYVEQIHSKVFLYGFATDPLVCNPLIDLYSKNGYIKSALSIFEELCSRDSVSWVAMISGFSQNGHEEEAIQLFCQMRKSGIIPTPYVFSSVLSASTKMGFYELGEQLHAQVFKWGFSSETFVCNALLSLYSRSENFIFAEQIFTEMNRCDGVTFNSLISGLSQRGFSDKALQLFEKMQLSGLKPDCVTIASLLSACASVEALHKGKQLHSYTIKAGLLSDIIIEGSLLDLYVKCSDLDTAREFFNSTTTENVVLWNVMLVAYGQLGDLSESFEIFCQMQVAGLKPNQYTYPSILRTCTSLGAMDLGEQIHTHVIKTGFELNVYVCSVLIDMYAKHGKLEIAREILERLTEKDVVSWTAMIAGYAQHELCIEALRLFEEMQIRGIRSDNIGFSSALSACAGIQALNQGRQIHAQSYVSGYAMDLSIGNSLVNLYARCGRIQDAYSAFQIIDAKDEISWNGLISGFAQSGHHEEALQVFTQMNRSGVRANLFTFCSVVSASANIADIKQGKQFHGRIIKTGYDSEIEAGNVLITLYAKCGSIDDAWREFCEMHERNEVSWNAMITGYSQHGFGNKALDLFEEMKRKTVKPNHVTFVGVLSACSHVGLVNKGLNYLKSMSEEHGLVPRPEHFNCVVDILGRAGLLQHAREFIEEMPIKPDAMIWRTLLSACTVHKNLEIGEFAAKHLLELEPEDSATYVLLSNIYAVTQKWNCRDQMRQMMKDRGVKKEPGRSWIEVKNSVHAFFVGDRLHPLADNIYEYLKDLNKRISEIGYVQDRYSLLHDIEQEQKDPNVYIHSEKLALAFGLISLSPLIPVRVIKNLRVCNDCHNWMKFVSKVSNRTLIVRDAYRFHHFKDGACSCRDYW